MDKIIVKGRKKLNGEISVQGAKNSVLPILVPSPNVAENHQFHNAMALAKDDGAILIEQKDLDGKILANKILELKNDRTKLVKISENVGRNAKKNALSEICKIITSL